ncbi:hypothetical protein V6N13_048026 [Hibiscus sabdariffa]
MRFSTTSLSLQFPQLSFTLFFGFNFSGFAVLSDQPLYSTLRTDVLPPKFDSAMLTHYILDKSNVILMVEISLCFHAYPYP